MKKSFLIGAALMLAFVSCKKDSECGCDQGPVSQVKTLSALQGALDSGATEVVLTEPLTDDAQITLPSAASADAVVSIEIPAGGHDVAIIQPAGATNAFSTVNLVIDQADNVEINTPRSSVFFNGDATAISSTTADNTLTIEAGASVGTLTVNKGSVMIYGWVETAEKGSGLSSTAKIVQKLGGTLGSATGFGEGQIGRTQGFLPGDAGWAVDRYLPADWESVAYRSRTNVFKVSVDATGSPANRAIAMGNAVYNQVFRNTQGKGIYVSNPNQSVLWDASVDIYVAADMLNTATPFRVELWMDVKGSTAYPILGVANVGENNEFGTTARPAVWRTYGYTDSESQDGAWGSTAVTVTEGWHTVSIRSNGEDLDYYIDDTYAGTLSRTNPQTPYVSYVDRLMLQVYNYNSVTSNVAGAVDLPDYSFNGYFSNLQLTIYE